MYMYIHIQQYRWSYIVCVTSVYVYMNNIRDNKQGNTTQHNTTQRYLRELFFKEE